MKIIVRPKIESEKTINYRDVRPGFVFEFTTGVIALKLKNDEAVLLTHDSDGNLSYFDTARGYKTCKIKKILGKLSEIVVDSNQE